jgi:hypothetical protein
MLAKLTSKNQITLPKAVVKLLPGVQYFEVEFRGGAVILKPVVVKARGSELRTIRARIKALGLTERDVEDAIRWARSRDA